MNRMLGVSSILNGRMFDTSQFESFIPVLRRHSSLAWLSSTLGALFAEYLKASKFFDYQKMFLLHQKYPEMDAFCFMKLLTLVFEDEDPELVLNKDFKKFANLLFNYKDFDQTQKEFLSQLIE